MLTDQELEEYERKLVHKAETRAEALGQARGEARGKSESVLAVIVARGLAISDAQRQHIRDCSDLAILDRYLRRAVSAASIDEVLATPLS